MRGEGFEPTIVLMGPMGAGKTTVAQALSGEVARRLAAGDPAFTKAGIKACVEQDTDREVERIAGKSVQDIFVDDGEPAFRAMERDVLASALGTPPAPGTLSIVALGGGSVMDPDSREVVRQVAGRGGAVVFLDLTPSEAARRVGFGVGRPMLGVNPRATWIRLMDQRRPTYESLATLTVNTTESPANDCAATIIDHLLGQGENQ